MMILIVCGLFFHGSALHVDRGFSPDFSEWLDTEMQSGFPGKPKTPSTSARAAEKHCSPEIFVGFNLEHVRAGFGSKVNNIMNQLAVAAYANVSVSMAADVGRLLDFVTTWISFFESPLPFCVKKKTSSDRNKMLSRQERVFFQNLSKSDPQYALDFKRAIYKTYYQYKPETTMVQMMRLQSRGIMLRPGP
jgi:hypothetical protein